MPTNTSDPEEGSAVVEFLGLAVMLMIPTVWFLVAVAQVQAASYAAVGAADQAARVYVHSDASSQVRDDRSETAVHAVLNDFSIDPSQATVTRQCPTDCQGAGELVSYEVEIRVPLPLMPEFGGWEHTLVSVSASSSALRGE